MKKTANSELKKDRKPGPRHTKIDEVHPKLAHIPSANPYSVNNAKRKKIAFHETFHVAEGKNLVWKGRPACVIIIEDP